MVRLPQVGHSRSRVAFPFPPMIPNHAQFLQAIGEKKLIRIGFYSLPDAGTVNRECAPLDYGAAPDAADELNRYWIWDYANTAGANPLGLLPDQIVGVQVLGTAFAPEQLGLEGRAWNTPRAWAPAAKPAAGPSDPRTVPPAK